jgi:hypothetical protein
MTAACAIACGGPSAASDGGTSDTGTFASLEECVVGTWFSEAPTCPCTPSSETPECAQPDCGWSEVFIFREDGTAFRFVATRSEATRTFSVVFACPIPSMWAVIDGERLAQGGDLTMNPGETATCNGSRLDWGVGTHHDRGTGPYADALAAVPEAAACVSVPY